MDPQQQLDELVREVRTMMDVQQKYFRTRTSAALDEARYHEGRVRNLLTKQSSTPTRPEPVQGELFKT